MSRLARLIVQAVNFAVRERLREALSDDWILGEFWRYPDKSL